MKNKLMNYLSKKDWILKLCLVLFANRLVHSATALTPCYLSKLEFERVWDSPRQKFMWVQTDKKERDKIWIEFENHYYRVWHGTERAFIALESSQEWFDMYYFLMHPDHGRNKLAGI